MPSVREHRGGGGGCGGKKARTTAAAAAGNATAQTVWLQCSRRANELSPPLGEIGREYRREGWGYRGKPLWLPRPPHWRRAASEAGSAVHLWAADSADEGVLLARMLTGSPFCYSFTPQGILRRGRNLSQGAGAVGRGEGRDASPAFVVARPMDSAGRSIRCGELTLLEGGIIGGRSGKLSLSIGGLINLMAGRVGRWGAMRAGGFGEVLFLRCGRRWL
jgi:hypothetical protein